jgi:hypothetical protein
MNVTLSLHDFEETNRIEFGKLFQIAESADESDETHRRFSAQANAMEGLLRTVYQSAAIMARKAESLEDTAEIWTIMVTFCDSTLASLRTLAEKRPRYTTKHLYDFALDTRNAAARRMELHL